MNKNVNDLMDRRRANLRHYQAEVGHEWQRIAKTVKVTPSHLSQILSGHRPFSERTARQMESRLRLGQGWFDKEHPSVGPSQTGDKSTVLQIAAAVDSAITAANVAQLREDPATLGHLVSLLYKDSSERGPPSEWFVVELVRLIVK